MEQLEKAKAQLNRYYELVNSSTSERGFYKALSEYIRMIVNSEVLTGILGIYVLWDRNKLFKRIDELTDDVLKELKAIFESIKNEIKKNKIDENWVKVEVDDTERTLTGKTQILMTSTGNFSLYILDQIEDVLRALKDTGHEEVSGKYTIYNSQKQFNGWKISEKAEELRKLVKKSRDDGERTVWGAWEKIWWAYATNLKKDETLKQFDKTIFQLDAGALANDMDEIMSGKPKDQRGHNYFENREDFRESAGSVHMRIIDGIDEMIEKAESEDNQTDNPNEKEPEKIKTSFSYSKDEGKLFYKDKMIIKTHKFHSEEKDGLREGKEGSKRKVLEKLWENKRIILNEITVEDGLAQNREALRSIAGFKTKDSVDSAIKFFVRKLKTKSIPAEIKSDQGQGYLLTLRD